MNASTILTIFGATGDLVRKKIIPALYILFQKGQLPKNIKVLGFARRDFSGNKYNEFIKESLSKVLKISDIDSRFYEIFEYVQGNLDNEDDYSKLKDAINSYNKFCGEDCVKLFYFSIQPHFYKVVAERIAKFEINKARLLIEKPYGNSEKSALELDKNIKKYFNESQIYRIDHYLHKKIIRQILDFRFNNSIIKSSWNPNEIKKVVISTKEDFGVEDRGDFYEGLGALKDVGQNHLLTIASLILMNNYKKQDSQSFIQERVKALKSLKQINNDEGLKQNTYRAQYKGYREIKDVNNKSNIETYFKVRVYSKKEGWENIPFILEAGKKLDKHFKEIKVYFETNLIFFEFYPEDKICIGIYSNKEKEVCLYKMEHKSGNFQYVGEYASIIRESIRGAQDYFLSIDEIVAQWKIIDRVIKGWEQDIVPLEFYSQGTTPKSNIY